MHLTAAEAFAATHPRTRVEHERYRPAQRDHRPKLVEYTPTEGDTWRGFTATTELTGIASGLVLIGLPGHTRGHAAVAVDAGDRWILHAGDAFYHHGQVDGSGHVPLALRGMERAIALDWKKVQANHERLTDLYAAAEPDLELVCAHDPTMFHRAKSRTALLENPK